MASCTVRAGKNHYHRRPGLRFAELPQAGQTRFLQRVIHRNIYRKADTCGELLEIMEMHRQTRTWTSCRGFEVRGPEAGRPHVIADTTFLIDYLVTQPVVTSSCPISPFTFPSHPDPLRVLENRAPPAVMQVQKRNPNCFGLLVKTNPWLALLPATEDQAFGGREMGFSWARSQRG